MYIAQLMVQFKSNIQQQLDKTKSKIGSNKKRPQFLQWVRETNFNFTQFQTKQIFHNISFEPIIPPALQFHESSYQSP